MLKKYLLILTTTLLPFMASATDYSDCFIPGEVAEYKVTWMGIPLAWSKNTTSSLEENGRSLIRIQTLSKSYKAYAKLYRVDDLKEVIIDPITGLPLRLDLKIKEGNIHKSELTLFDHANRTALFIDRLANTTNQVEIGSHTREIVSFLYSMRNENIEHLATQTHTLFVGGKLYDMTLKIHKEDTVKLPHYGKVKCVKIEPIADFDGLFLRKGKITFWTSKHNRSMITRIKAQVPVGNITVKLQQVSGPGNDFWVNDQ